MCSTTLVLDDLNNSAICAWLSQTVSPSILTSSLMVSSGWYITISPLFGSMFVIPLDFFRYDQIISGKSLVALYNACRACITAGPTCIITNLKPNI